MSESGWIGFDLDGTIAEYDKFMGPEHVGAPIPATIAILKEHLAAGRTVKIFTARVSCPDREQWAVRRAIANWCVEHIGQVLEITCEKDYSMWCLYDDRCIAVEKNTGRILGGEFRE